MQNRIVKESRHFMHTKVEFSTWCDLPRSKIYSVFQNGFDEFTRVVRKFSRFKKNSELSILNQKKNLKVSNELLNLVEYSLKLAERTNGAFDPTIIDFLEAYGYDHTRSFSNLSNKKLIKQEVNTLLGNRPSYKDIKIEKKTSKIKLKDKQSLDLGGIDKGYAIDLAFEKLFPLKNFIINAGGDIRAAGGSDNYGFWPVGLKVPEYKQLGYIELKDQSVCCSGSHARRIMNFHHLIDPAKGEPTDELKTVFVLSKTALKADSLATAVYVLGNKQAKFINENKLSVLSVKPGNDIITYNFPRIRSLSKGRKQ